MMYKRLLRVDYCALAQLLSDRLDEAQDPDMPEHELSFATTRSILAGKVDSLLVDLHKPFNGKSVVEQEVDPLLDLLFADRGRDVVMDMSVSHSPGCVVRIHGKSVVLPLIFIEVS